MEPETKPKDIVESISQTASQHQSAPILISSGIGAYSALKYAEAYHTQAQVFLNPITHCNWYQHIKLIHETIQQDRDVSVSWLRLLSMWVGKRVLERQILLQPMLFINHIKAMNYAQVPIPNFAARMRATCIDRDGYQITDAIVCNDILSWLDSTIGQPKKLRALEKKSILELSNSIAEKDQPSIEFSEQPS
tara:strand:- start:2565 stop:3140 length:576 start_codon:yes stop_codon:yes gene_type:complete